MCKNLLYKGIADFKYQIKEVSLLCKNLLYKGIAKFDNLFNQGVRLTWMYYIL